MLNIYDHRSVCMFATWQWAIHFKYEFTSLSFPILTVICKTHNPNTFYRLIVLKHTWNKLFCRWLWLHSGLRSAVSTAKQCWILSECNYRNVICEMKNNFCCSLYCGAAEERKQISVMFSLAQKHADKRGREDRDVPGEGVRMSASPATCPVLYHLSLQSDSPWNGSTQPIIWSPVCIRRLEPLEWPSCF